MDADVYRGRGEYTSRVSRRRLLRSTANLTAGLVAVGQIGTIEVAAAEPADAARANAWNIAPDHDPVTGEIFDCDCHHHWDTV